MNFEKKLITGFLLVFGLYAGKYALNHIKNNEASITENCVYIQRIDGAFGRTEYTESIGQPNCLGEIPFQRVIVRDDLGNRKWYYDGIGNYKKDGHVDYINEDNEIIYFCSQCKTEQCVKKCEIADLVLAQTKERLNVKQK